MIHKQTFTQNKDTISDRKHYDAIVIGSGMGGLTSACLLAKKGLSVLVLEQNYLPGGCTSSYWRKGYVFEAGATTLVGLDENMPLKYLLEETGIELSENNIDFEVKSESRLNVIELEFPMKVYLKSGKVICKYKDLNQWIKEAERVFGKKNQRTFWEFCHKISQFVWQVSLKQTHFPPTRFSDIWQTIKHIDFRQLRYAGYSLFSTEWLLKRFDLLENEDFVEYINEQLIITAQNNMREVNVLFGATALCYTNFGNYYVPGGLINLVSPLINYLKRTYGELHLREEVVKINRYSLHNYVVETNTNSYTCDFIISGIPINNTLEVFDKSLKKYYEKKVLKSAQLNSAFQMGIAFKTTQEMDCLHHQIHLSEAPPFIHSKSIFVSFSHPKDRLRSPSGEMVASVSTHISYPENTMIFDKESLENFIINELVKKSFFKKEDIIYFHSSAQHAWEKWTKRVWGFVGGYPQYLKIKPWQMINARLDGKKAYICGDSVYPGQGIPGTVLSGIIAVEKLNTDWF